MDTLSPEERSEQMRRIKARDTEPELRLRRLVWNLGFRYRKHVRNLPGTPDIALVSLKRAIFLHGCFWHRHNCPAGQRTPRSRTQFWNRKFKQNVTRDLATQSALKKAGWKSLIVWECELVNISSVERRIKRFLDA